MIWGGHHAVHINICITWETRGFQRVATSAKESLTKYHLI